ncbi:hypothetical protein LRS05_03965 [Flavobacterium sp. J372]|uniref:hypothetical protein n=1 Tax=Flavobacterium sp. J372 TaxID=2898436 RepID=UPI0021511B94|nr:hypothetical protein [Flavobacterium sp. J372]MCR5861356.1 hypothetical protein [Flavobacterium sp. J372]
MVCAGFYNIGKNKFSSDGFIVAKAGKDGELYDVKTYEIPLEILNQNLSESKKKKNEKKDEEGKAEFEALKLQEVIVNNDGSLVLLGEQYYTELHQKPSTSKSKVFTHYRTYHYNDLLAARIDKSGNLSWIKKMPKKQRGRNQKGGMSYKNISANGSHYFLYLDNVKNFNLPADKKPALHTDGEGGYFTSYKIDDATGAVSAGSVFNVRDVEDMTIYEFGTERILKTAENEFVLEFYKKKKEDVMLKVKML